MGKEWGRKDGSVVKILVAPPKDSGSISGEPGSCDSRASVTAVPGNLRLSSGLLGHHARTWYTDKYAGKTPEHVK